MRWAAMYWACWKISRLVDKCRHPIHLFFRHRDKIQNLQGQRQAFGFVFYRLVNRSLKSEYGVFCITIGSAQLRTGYAMMPCAWMRFFHSLCMRRSDEYPVKIRLRSLRTMTALFIMILPLKMGADEAGGTPMRHWPGAGTEHFFYMYVCRFMDTL